MVTGVDAATALGLDRKRVVEGKRGDLGGGRIIKKKKKKNHMRKSDIKHNKIKSLIEKYCQVSTVRTTLYYIPDHMYNYSLFDGQFFLHLQCCVLRWLEVVIVT